MTLDLSKMKESRYEMALEAIVQAVTIADSGWASVAFTCKAIAAAALTPKEPGK